MMNPDIINRIGFFCKGPVLRNALLDIHSAANIEKIVSNGEFMVYYQPRFSAGSQSPEMVEALLRFAGKGNKKISTETLVHELERSGAIGGVTTFVVRTVCSHILQLTRSLGYSPKVAINMAPTLFTDFGFMQGIQKIIQDNNINPTMIEFEITESTMVNDIVSAGHAATDLRKSGFGIGLDDFGSGFCGLKYLDAIPATALKIDRHFICGLGHREKCNTIVAVAARLADAMGMVAVAEGVETQKQLSLVTQMGYGEVQGFLLARPMSFKELAIFLNPHQPSDEALLHSRSIAGCL